MATAKKATAATAAPAKKRTPNAAFMKPLTPSPALAAVVGAIPTGTLGDPDYIARLVSLLASPQAASAVGATFDINGGLYLR